MAGRRHQYISLFSGSMGLDLGLEKAGLSTAVCVEIDPTCCATMRRNRPQLPVIQQDINTLKTSDILDAAGLEVGEAFAVVGGPPCQSFSTGGLRQSIRDRRGSLFAEFLRVIDEAKPRFFVFENVGQIVTAALSHRPIEQRPGKRWHLSSYKAQNGQLLDNGDAPLRPDEQAGSALSAILDAFDERDYSLTFGILNSADFGAPQRRFRFVAIGSRDHENVSLPTPTHSQDPTPGLLPWRTLREAIGDLKEEEPKHSNYTPVFQHYFSHVPPGGNWRNLPEQMQRDALGVKAFAAGGGKTGFFRRLSWEEPSPTIVGKPNRKSCAICHPTENRPLSIRECARVQGFPDDWEFVGQMHPQYLQIGNAVPVALGEAIGQTLRDAARKRSRNGLKNGEWKERRAEMIRQAELVLKFAARNKKARKTRLESADAQKTLFD